MIRAWLAGTAGAILCVHSGCAAPNADSPSDTVLRGKGQVLVLKPLSADGSGAAPGLGDPRAGHLAPDLTERHGLVRAGSPADDPGVVFYEGFDQVESADDLEWLRLEQPDPRVVRESGNAFLRLDPPTNAGGTSGLSRQLSADALAGKRLLCQLRTRYSVPVGQSAPASAPGLSNGASPPHPIIRFVLLLEGGIEEPVDWPLVWEYSPGWEVQRATWLAPCGLLGVRLEVRTPAGSGLLDLDDVLIRDMNAPDLPAVWSSQAGAKRPGPGDNLLVGGDFETGLKGFGVLARRQAPGSTSEAQTWNSPWYFHQPGPIGRTCLAIPLSSDRRATDIDSPGSPGDGSERIRIWFGPATLYQPAAYVVSFQARATEPLPLEVSLWLGGSQIGPVRMTVDRTWREVSHSFLIMGRQIPSDAYLTIDVVPRPVESKAGLWLDGIALTQAVTPRLYQAPNLLELGILDSAGDPLDVGHCFDLNQTVEFGLRVINYDRRAFVGQICMDVVDGMDRPVWRSDLGVSLSALGEGGDAGRSSHFLRLGRGYYRILTTAWLGSEGNGIPVSQAVRAFTVLNLSDPVPDHAPIGVPVAPGKFSARMTQWGLGWARVPLEGPAAHDDLQAWSDLLRDCRRQQLDIIGAYLSEGTELPPCVGSRCIVPVERFRRARSHGAGLAGHVVRADPADEPARLVLAVGSGENLPGQIAELSAYGWPIPGDAIELAQDHALLPEELEPRMERLRAELSAGSELRLWARCPQPVLSSNVPEGIRMDRGIPASETMRRVLLDPALEASEMVRALAIRRWYGFDRIFLDAYPLATFDPTGRAGVPATLSEYDHSPKPALAALDFLNEMLNDASPLDWIDGAKGARAVAFERGDDRGVALLWRPFGSTPIMHRLVGIGRLVSTDSGSEGGTVEVRNCFGQLEPCTIDGRDLIVPVSAMVLYVTAEGPPWQELLRALPFALGEPDLPKNN